VLLLGTSIAFAAPPNDDCASPYVVTELPFQHAPDSTTATVDPLLPPFTCYWTGSVDDDARTVWYSFTAPRPMTLAVDTFETLENGFTDTAIVAYRGTCGALEQITCNARSFDRYYGDLDLSYALVQVAAGETVLIRVFAEDGGQDVTVTFREAPMFPVSTQDPVHVNGHPAVAMQPDGGFLVVWRENSGPTFPHFPAMAARRYDTNGAAQGPQFSVNTSSAQGSYYPEVDIDGLGNFVVAWGSFSTGIWARRLDPAGTGLGPEIAVATSTSQEVDVAADADGDFVVVWRDGNFMGGDVFAQRFDATGAAVGGSIAVQGGELHHPRVGMADDGGFVVAWTDTEGLDGSYDGVFARLYDASGTSVGGAFLVNETTTLRQGDRGPGVSMAPDGTFVITWWDDVNTPACRTCVRMRRFDAAGAPLGGEFKVNEDDVGTYYRPSVAHDTDGGFLVQWSHYSTGPMVRRFDAAGAPRGAQAQVSHVDGDYQDFGEVAAGDDGFVVVWDHWPEGNDVVVYARRFPPEGAPICAGMPSCRTTAPSKASLTIADKDPNKGDRFTWKWTKGAATTSSDFGDPVQGDSYMLCLYEGSFADNSTRVSVLGASTCGLAPCWKNLADGGFRYVDKKALSDGAQKVLLKPGPEGSAKVVFKGKGTRLRDPLLPIQAPVVVQLVSSTGACWEAVYDGAITTNTSTQFAAKSD
jgi:hypothetical protein